MLSRAKYIALAVIALIVAGFLYYSLPQVDVVRIVGTDVKRTDVSNDATQTRDIYLINARSLSDPPRPRTFRNEDNWMYFKFASGDLQTEAKIFAEEGMVVAVRHYGFRLPIFSWFPNALSMWEVEEDYSHLPIMNGIILIVLAAIVFLIRRQVMRVLDWLEGLTARRPAPEPAPRPEPARSEPDRSEQKGDDALDAWASGDDKKD